MTKHARPSNPAKPTQASGFVCAPYFARLHNAFCSTPENDAKAHPGNLFMAPKRVNRVFPHVPFLPRGGAAFFHKRLSLAFPPAPATYLGGVF